MEASFSASFPQEDQHCDTPTPAPPATGTVPGLQVTLKRCVIQQAFESQNDSLPSLACRPGRHHHTICRDSYNFASSTEGMSIQKFPLIVSPVEVSSPPLLRSPYSFLSHQTGCQNLFEAKLSTSCCFFHELPKLLSHLSC